MKIVCASGQTCNQFWIYSSYIADCIENKEKMAIWVPDITLRYFPKLRSSEFILFPLYSDKLSKYFGYELFIKILSTFFSNKYAILFCKVFLNMLPNIDFVDPHVGSVKSIYWVKHLNEINSIFVPDKSITDEVNEVFAKIKKRNTVIVGVHVRYGDYRTYMDGKYFYTLNEYKDIMQRIIYLFPENEVVFFIASNENISLSSFEGIDCFSLKESFSVKDLYGLSISNYIVGPPSTFSGWASLYGDVPLYFIENTKDDFFLDSFKLIKEIWL